MEEEMKEQSQEEVRLLNLRLFEVVIISKFLSAHDKMCSLSLLSKSWKSFVCKNYAWSSFPSDVHKSCLHLYLEFVCKFTSLEGVAVPFCPLAIMTDYNLKLL